LTPVRAGALLVLLLASAGIYGVAHSTAFGFDDLQIDGARLTARSEVESALDAARGQNLFSLETAPLAAKVASLTTVRDASVSVRLPGTLVVALDEREAILVWKVGQRRYLVDGDGTLFSVVLDGKAAEIAGLPVVDDQRAASAGLSVGRTLDAVDLDAATRLASLAPSDVGSAADSLAVQVTDRNGYVIRARPNGWSAVFGFYTPTLRTPALVPGQVRLLRSLLIGREHLIGRVILASDTDGTYVPLPTPTPGPTSEPDPTPRP